MCPGHTPIFLDLTVRSNLSTVLIMQETLLVKISLLKRDSMMEQKGTGLLAQPLRDEFKRISQSPPWQIL